MQKYMDVHNRKPRKEEEHFTPLAIIVALITFYLENMLLEKSIFALVESYHSPTYTSTFSREM